MNKSDACREVDMITLMSALWRRAWIIALISVVLGAICFAWARFLITPTYEASALMYVNNTQDPGKPISNSELSAAQSLVDTYMVILSSRATLDQIRSAAKLTYTDKQLTKMIRAQAVNGTEVFEITVASTDPQEARNIANTVTQVLPARIADVVEGSSVRVVDYAQLPTSKASPSIPRYTLLGMLTGLILSCAFFILRELFDNQIRSEDQLLQAYPQIPVWRLSLSFCSKAMAMTTGTGRRRDPTNDLQEGTAYSGGSCLFKGTACHAGGPAQLCRLRGV